MHQQYFFLHLNYLLQLHACKSPRPAAELPSVDNNPDNNLPVPFLTVLLSKGADATAAVGIGLSAAQSSNVACETLSSVLGSTNAPISSLYLIGTSSATSPFL